MYSVYTIMILLFYSSLHFSWKPLMSISILLQLYSTVALSWAKTILLIVYSFGPTQRGLTIVRYLVF